ncbi:hypothetical protein [Dyadobacter fanqingshengii]|uniref:DUF4178 domain-containing protein n=1 Tax=Dyadobacter fanqingshengii TaxID=2906443 RepID=A0A9X1PER7_9BACT|nr:hypothetical protein [Dyadobacter fanqingshengii]MCF0043661.1 hypothetical protein [Dyadobacter fanqingshengii]USJ34723.1 hypothetical protein NFI81_18670 [Dyadobacter fanqingshengii]
MRYFLLCCLLFLATNLSAQVLLGPWADPGFRPSSKQTGYFELRKGAKVFDQLGKEVLIGQDEVISVTSFYTGSYNGYSGDWGMALVDNLEGPKSGVYELYIPENELGKRLNRSDFSRETFNDNAKDNLVSGYEGVLYRKPIEAAEFRKNVMLSLLGLAIAVFAIYFLLGGKRSCPKCNQRWSRVKLKSVYAGTNTYQGTRTVRKDVQGGSGGYVEVDEPYTYSKKVYHRFYKCKKCEHGWDVIS